MLAALAPLIPHVGMGWLLQGWVRRNLTQSVLAAATDDVVAGVGATGAGASAAVTCMKERAQVCSRGATRLIDQY
jgi:hypothetical protein